MAGGQPRAFSVHPLRRFASDASWMTGVSEDDERALAIRLLAEWDEGRGKAKSRIEREVWDDGRSHGRRFDRFISRTLGASTTRRSRLSDRIEDLSRQIRGLGEVPVGAAPQRWERQLQHARDACTAALRIWNDPSARFRTGGFALLFATAWNSLSIAVLQLDGGEWRELDDAGSAVIVDGVERALSTAELLSQAFPSDTHRGLRANTGLWLELRHHVAHRHLPALDHSVIPHAQAGLLNFEAVVVGRFGSEFALGSSLSVPLQLTGFRDPGVLSSRKQLQASLPLDVQAVLAEPERIDPALGVDETFMLRVAFVPMVPSSGRSPDCIAYFARPGEVPEDLANDLERFLVLPKPLSARPSLLPTEVVGQVSARTGWRFDTNLHAEAARRLGARPARGEPERTVDLRWAEYIGAHKRHLYTPAWVERLVEELATPKGFEDATGKEPRPLTT
jgi:hypothetical protein